MSFPSRRDRTQRAGYGRGPWWRGRSRGLASRYGPVASGSPDRTARNRLRPPLADRGLFGAVPGRTPRGGPVRTSRVTAPGRARRRPAVGFRPPIRGGPRDPRRAVALLPRTSLRLRRMRHRATGGAGPARSAPPGTGLRRCARAGREQGPGDLPPAPSPGSGRRWHPLARPRGRSRSDSAGAGKTGCVRRPRPGRMPEWMALPGAGSRCHGHGAFPVHGPARCPHRGRSRPRRRPIIRHWPAVLADDPASEGLPCPTPIPCPSGRFP